MVTVFLSQVLVMHKPSFLLYSLLVSLLVLVHGSYGNKEDLFGPRLTLSGSHWPIRGFHSQAQN